MVDELWQSNDDLWRALNRLARRVKELEARLTSIEAKPSSEPVAKQEDLVELGTAGASSVQAN